MEQTAQTNKVTAKKIISIVLDVLLYTFLALAIVVVALTIMSKVAQTLGANFTISVKRLCMLTILSVFCLVSFAQSSVTGIVKDKTGEPIVKFIVVT